MTNRFIYLLSTIAAIDVLTLFAQEGTTKPAEGTLTLDKKSYQLVTCACV